MHSLGRALTLGRSHAAPGPLSPWVRSPLTPWVPAQNYLGYNNAAAQTFADLDLTVDTSVSGNASDVSDVTTTPTLARAGDIIGLGTDVEGLEVVLSYTDLEAHYDAQAAAVGALLPLNGNAGFSPSAVVTFYLWRPAIASTIISIGALVQGDYSLHKDGAGVVAVTKNSFTKTIRWQGGNTSSDAPATAGTHTVKIILTHAGAGATGRVTIDGVDQGTAFTTWNTISTATAAVHAVRTYALSSDIDCTVTMKAPASASLVCFQRYAP